MSQLGTATNCAQVAGPAKSRVRTALVLALFFLPVAAVLLQFLVQRVNFAAAERAAEVQALSAAPRTATWGVLGAVRLQQGRIAEALPLLERAAVLEQVAGHDTRDTLTYAKANLEGVEAGVPGASLQAAAQALTRAELEVPRLSKGKQAATWFSAGLFWLQMGREPLAIDDLKKAVALQSDDWVEDGGGQRYQYAGLSEYYQTMLAGAMER